MKRFIQKLILLLASFLVGLFSWNGPSLWCFLGVILIPWFISRDLDRRWPLLPIAAYQLGASVALIQGASKFYDSHFLGFCFVSAWTLFQVIPWLLVCPLKKRGLNLFVGSILAFAVFFFLPPFNYFSLFNPIVASGLFFPGLGIWGIALFVSLWASLASRYYRISVFFLVVSALFNTWIQFQVEAPLLQVASINTSFPDYSGENTTKEDAWTRLGKRTGRMLETKKLVEESIDSGKRLILLPESVGGKFFPGDLSLWETTIEKAQKESAFIVLGGWQHTGNGKSTYRKEIQFLGAEAIPGRINARYPMPGADFNPFGGNSSTPPDWWGLKSNGTVEALGLKIGILNCYEEIAPFTAIQTYRQKPDLVLVPSNLAWAGKGSTLPRSMRQISRIWGRLFDIPTFFAVNF